MTRTLKIIITSKKNLIKKYGDRFGQVNRHLTDLVKADKQRNITTQLIYIDDRDSAAKAGIQKVETVTMSSCKGIVDLIYKRKSPAYLVIFGAQDVIPLQMITNLAEDDDKLVDSDLPYACDAPYSDDIRTFTGPTRVVGRIPDVPETADMRYLKTIFDTIINYKPVHPDKLKKYFAVTADEWKESTEVSLSRIFNNNEALKISPPTGTHYKQNDFKPLSHFYNCHGDIDKDKFWGQKGDNYPTAQSSEYLERRISPGTVVAAECCYGTRLFKPTDKDKNLSIANTYFKYKAIAFTGSSTTAYGPSSGQGLADLITVNFMKNILCGASSGRALLQARQSFLSSVGPHLDPYELKTLAQFYLLGDPSLQPAFEIASKTEGNTVLNRRLNLFNKGVDLKATVVPCERAGKARAGKKHSDEIKGILKTTGFTGREPVEIYQVPIEKTKVKAFTKKMSGSAPDQNVTFRAFIKKPKKSSEDFKTFGVLMLKEKGKSLLGWRVYQRK